MLLQPLSPGHPIYPPSLLSSLKHKSSISSQYPPITTKFQRLSSEQPHRPHYPPFHITTKRLSSD
ncbi:hypothetical protein BofuT4_P152840.1 [Botrytis cinerea T4]|uniref:Uncharacterized protein n=1 Tax=Botryotinia fuckeliana (strain T4) TaxID=999810 RepID=G2YVS4_BOTF4|nr:hypothetical protein BofuT4_P152840.1 [Botrytis cinerea T4]